MSDAVENGLASFDIIARPEGREKEATEGRQRREREEDSFIILDCVGGDMVSAKQMLL